MSERNFVFRLGPMTADGVCVYFVFPGNVDAYMFPARDDAAAWLRIGAEYDLASLDCEPLLDTSDRPSAVTPRPHDAYTSHALASMTYSHLAKDPMAAVKNEALITDFLRACDTYLESSVSSQSVVPDVKLRWRGEPDIRTSARLTAGASGAELRFSSLDLQDQDTGEAVSFGVTFKAAPEFAVDAMRRGFGLENLPVPFVGREAGAGRANDMILLLLISALNALASFSLPHGGGTGIYRLGKIDIECEATVAT